MKSKFDPSILRPADTLIYSGLGAFDLAIEFRTAAWAAHVEGIVYVSGPIITAASRNGVGVGRYDLRTKGLQAVLRPKVQFDLSPGIAWMNRLSPEQKKYGWIELTNCLLPWRVNAAGQFCSQFWTNFLRRCNFDPFSDTFDSAKVTPRDFLESNDFTVVWSK